MQVIKKVLAYKGLVVLREFDHGAQTDFWLVPMSGEELEKWWLSQETFEEPLEIEQFFYDFFNEAQRQKNTGNIEWPGEIINVTTDEEGELWFTLYETGNHYFCHYYGDSDSYLDSPSGKRIHHKGFGAEFW